MLDKLLTTPQLLSFRTLMAEGSFVAAAQALGLSSAAVSKHVQQLEARLGQRLFQRTTRVVQPTEAAQQLEQLLASQAGQLDELLQVFDERQGEPRGRLRVSVPQSYGELFLRRPMAEFAERYPRVLLDVSFSDSQVHLIEQGYDLIVRIGVLEDSALMVRKVGDCPLHLCASPAFLAEQGGLISPAQLSGLPAVTYNLASGPPLWVYQDANGLRGQVRLASRFASNSASMMKQACVQGLGIAILPYFACREELEDGRLVRVMPHLETHPERGIYVLYPEKRLLALRVRLFIDWLQQCLRN